MTIRALKMSDPLGRYYTRSKVASLLINMIKNATPSLVLDLGAGDGALVKEASKVWTSTRFVTVDIDKKAGSVDLPVPDNSMFRHHIGDALDKNLAARLDIKLGDADIALCNPPYITARWKKHFSEILEDAGLSHILPKLSDAPSDILFIAQNLRFLKSGGTLGLILPDGIIAGERYKKFRDTLVRDHRIERVIELPRRIFRGTDAKAHIVVLSKKGNATGFVEIHRADETGTLSKAIQLPSDYAKNRLDYSYYIDEIAFKRVGKPIRSIAITLTRGNCSSAQRKHMKFPVFHTTDFNSETLSVPSKFLIEPKYAVDASLTIAAPGDILIARVGRNLENKVCRIHQGTAVVSDCVFVLRVSPDKREQVFKFLTSEKGREALLSASHGVAARFITKDALLNIKMCL